MNPITHKAILRPEPALHYGVKLIGDTVKLENGILCSFTADSYALLPFEISNWSVPWEIIIGFSEIGGYGGIMSSTADTNPMTPFYELPNGFSCYLAGIGSPITWDDGEKAVTPEKHGGWFRCRLAFNGTAIYTISHFTASGWSILKTTTRSAFVKGLHEIILGNNRGQVQPYLGQINLNVSYIRHGVNLLWEGVKGAYWHGNH